MSTGPATEHTEPQVRFRRGKKRKAYRQRSEGADDSAGDAAIPEGDNAAREAADVQETEAGISAEALRLRNARRFKLKGVQFRADGSLRPETEAMEDNDELALMIREAADSGGQIDSLKKFAPQTGLVGELVNKHMEEYIEAQLAKRHSVPSPAQQQTAQESLRPQGSAVTTQITALSGKPAAQTAKQGRILEVDLGDDVRDRNRQMTETAWRRLRGEQVEDEDTSRRKKVRLGRDGKPWRPRNRRDSDDIKRDLAVEAVMRENRVDVGHETPVNPGPAPANDQDDTAADDRIAEQFRREFMDAMSQRRRRRKATHQPARPGAKKDEEILRGPKLGGSRNSRAAMRNLLLKEQEKKR